MEKLFNSYRRSILKAQQLAGNLRILRYLESDLFKNSMQTYSIPPLFIVGSPRTGSTLLFQILLRKYHFSYFNNLQAFLYGTPALAARLTHKFSSTILPTYSLDNEYGYVRGFFSPSEAGAVFRDWFGESDLENPHVAESKKIHIRDTVRYITSLSSSPFLSKNLYNSIRLKKISSVFPEAFYIWIRRDPLYTGQSLLKMRQNIYGTKETWASVKPFNYETLIQYNPFEQVIRQVKTIDDYIEFELNDQKHMEINYEALCTNPDREMDRVSENYFKSFGFRLRSRALLPFNLNMRKRRYLQDVEWQQLLSVVKNIYGTVNYPDREKDF